jgi:type I restriction enzyme S subunit
MRHKENISIEWKQKSFMECLVPVSFGRLKQVQANSYLKMGKYPIVDQGKDIIAGWTNEEAALLKEDLPLIIFGDHTRIFKYVDFPFALGADGTKLIKPKQDEFSTRFFYYYLLTLTIPERGYNRHYKLLKEQIIRYPIFIEQQKIAAILFKIQQAIEIQESIIEKTRELKKSTLHHVFTRGLHGEKTKETEIGPIPESWDVVPIAKVYIFTKKPKEIILSNYDHLPFIAMDLIPIDLPNSGKFKLKKSTEISSGTYVEDGDFLLAKITPCFENGKQCIVTGLPGRFGIASTEIIPIKENPGISDKYFLYYYLLKEDVRRLIAGKMEGATGRQRVPVNLLQKFMIPFPLLTEQRETTELLLTIDHKIELHAEKKSTLQDLFKTMLNKLMTGEIRVKDLDIDVSEVSA